MEKVKCYFAAERELLQICSAKSVYHSPGRTFQRRRVRSPWGFSFAEVMFAVVILGIGFVMVAAIFPVAVEQTRSTSDEAAAAQLARGSVCTITSTTTGDQYAGADANANLGITKAFADTSPLFDEISGCLISQTDPRFACVPFYCNEAEGGRVRIITLVVRRWVHPRYNPADLSGEGELVPQGISVHGFTHQGDGTDTVEIDKSTDSAGIYERIAPGTFIIIRKFDGGDGPSGRVFRVAAKHSETTDLVSWKLDPAHGLLPGDTLGSASAAVIGRDLADPADPKSGYVGPSQDVAVYTTFIRPN